MRFLLLLILPVAHSLSFLIAGDMGKLDSKASAVASSMKMYKSSTSSIISLGDQFYRVKDGSAKGEDGVSDAKDSKFDLFSSIYGELMELPWYVLYGNHDYFGNADAISERNRYNANWNAEAFSTKSFSLDDGKKAVFVFLDTNLLVYGYDGEKESMKNNFKRKNWIRGLKTIEGQIAWIKDTLSSKECQSADFLLVFGYDSFLISRRHHPVLAGCDGMGEILDLAQIFTDAGVTAYIHGHKHSMGQVKHQGVTYILSGAASKNSDSGCSVDDTQFAGDKIFGFTRAEFAGDNLNFFFIDQKNEVLHKSTIESRKASKRA